MLSVEKKDEAGQLWAFLMQSPALGAPLDPDGLLAPAESTSQSLLETLSEEPSLCLLKANGVGISLSGAQR